MSAEPTDLTTDAQQGDQTAVDTAAADTVVVEEILVEEVSIDGMCGVY